jgi:hypothetical protein
VEPELAVIIPEFESAALLPRLILVPTIAIVPEALLVIAVVNELGPPVLSDAPEKVSEPLFIKKPGVAPEFIVSPLLKAITLAAPMVSVVVLNMVEFPQVVLPVPFQVRLEPV